MEHAGRLHIWPFPTLNGHLVHFIAIWYILGSFGTFSPVLVCCAKKNLATLLKMQMAATVSSFGPREDLLALRCGGR
jgi:hypothetical protein